MATSTPVFNQNKESWDSYRERLEHYFIALDIIDSPKKKSILVNCIAPQYYERLRNLCFPSTVNDKTYEEILNLLSNLFAPTVVVYKERKNFYHVCKNKHENASQWHERIRLLAIKCQFGNRTEAALLDKFVTSFSGTVFEKFCEVGTDLTLSKALEIAQRYDTIESKPVAGPNPPRTNEFKKHNNQNPQQSGPSNKPNQTPNQRAQNQPANQGKPFKKFYPKGPLANVNIHLNMKKTT